MARVMQGTRETAVLLRIGKQPDLRAPKLTAVSYVAKHNTGYLTT